MKNILAIRLVNSFRKMMVEMRNIFISYFSMELMLMRCKRKCFQCDIAKETRIHVLQLFINFSLKRKNFTRIDQHYRYNFSSLPHSQLTSSQLLPMPMPLTQNGCLNEAEHSQDELLIDSNRHLNVCDLNIYKQCFFLDSQQLAIAIQTVAATIQEKKNVLTSNIQILIKINSLLCDIEVMLRRVINSFKLDTFCGYLSSFCLMSHVENLSSVIASRKY